MGNGLTEGLDELAAATTKIVAPGAGEVMNVFGVEVTAVLTAEQTGGAYSMYYIDCAPGAGAPPHVHSREDEAFHVLEGEVAVWKGGEGEVVAGAGSTVFLPKGTPHAFRNPGAGRTKMLGVCSPAGHERFFADAAKMVPGPDGRPDMAEALAVCAKHGIDLLPPPGAAA